MIEPNFLDRILQSTQMALVAFGRDVQYVALEIINFLASRVYCEQDPDSYLYAALMPFVKRMFDMIAESEYDESNRTELGQATFMLLCVYRVRYDEIVEMLMQPFANDPERRKAMQLEFKTMAPQDMLHNNRVTQLQFSNRFDRFLANMTWRTAR